MRAPIEERHWTAAARAMPATLVCRVHEALAQAIANCEVRVRLEALEEVLAILWGRVEDEEYGHAKAAVTLCIERVNALAARSAETEEESDD